MGEALAARLEGSGGLFAQQEETGQLEKDINLREHQLDNPEMVDMLLQRWFAQRSFCVKNVGDRRQLAETFWKVQRNSKRAQGRRYVPKKSIRGKLTSTASPLRSSSSLFVDKMETGAVEADLTTETWRRIKRAMIKLKRKCRVLEGQWVEVPRMTLPRLQKRCRVLQLKAQLELWLRGEWLGPVWRSVHDVSGQLVTSMDEVSEQLATLRGRAERDVRSHGSGDARNLVANLGVPGSGTVRSLARGSSFRTRSSVAAGDSRKSMKVKEGSRPEELGRCGAELSALAARRPFTYEELCERCEGSFGGGDGPSSSASLRAVPPTLTFELWEVIISKYKAARESYLEHLARQDELAKQQLIRDLKEKPHLKQDRLGREQLNKAGEPASELKAKTQDLQQNVSLCFTRSLELESHDDLLRRYQSELEDERRRESEVNRQVEEAQVRWRSSKMRMKPNLEELIPGHHILEQLQDPKAQEKLEEIFFLNEATQPQSVFSERELLAWRRRGEPTAEPTAEAAKRRAEAPADRAEAAHRAATRELLRLLKALWPPEDRGRRDESLFWGRGEL
eukprot:g21132.t1